MQECAIVLGSCSFRESWEKSGSTVRSAGKNWKPGGGKWCFPLVSPGVLTGGWETHMEQHDTLWMDRMS